MNDSAPLPAGQALGWPPARDARALSVRRSSDDADRISSAAGALLETIALGGGLALGAGRGTVALRLAGPRGGAARRLAVPTLEAALADLSRETPSGTPRVADLLVLDPDADLIAACLASLCASAPGPAAVAVARSAEDAPGRWDRPLFDWGYVRLKPGAGVPVGEATDDYVRSDLLTDLSLLREPSTDAISMQTLGHNGRFANQLWQYAFLWFYGLRNNCRVQTPRWAGSTLYGIKSDPPDPSFTRQAFTVFTGVERHLWTMAEPPVNLDFFGYFQEIPESWRRHRQLLRRLFTPKDAFVDLIERWFKRTVPADATLIGIHVRRGDYSYYDHNQVPWFRPIPIDWYDALLDELWPTLERPVLFVATDDAAEIGPHFARYAPILAPANEIAIPEFAFMPDFCGMRRCAVLAASNSSFSRMAAMLADDGQIAYLPNMKAQRFERYAPWYDEDFWARFEA